MSKEQLLHELVDAFEQLIATATNAEQHGVTRSEDVWGHEKLLPT